MTIEALDAHLATGTTTVCRAWSVLRKDGVHFGFTDHDGDLILDGQTYRADSGLTARALQQTTGLSVDNTEALGALSDASISETDLAAGRFDAAEVRVWLVNWTDTAQRVEVFSGTIGEVTRSGAEFRAELRGLSEPLNQPTGYAYTRTCSAVLGDRRCRFDLSTAGYLSERAVETIEDDGQTLRFAAFPGFEDRWFEFGRVDVISGPASGLTAVVKSDRIEADGGRTIKLWGTIRADLRAGDLIRITAGCDKRTETCRIKFGNFLNFRGFPFIPGEDWLTAYPKQGQPATGGSLFLTSA